MTIVAGQIESLKKLKEILNQNGITRFNSIGDINNFVMNYDSEKDEITKQVERALELEINNLHTDLIRFQQLCSEVKGKNTAALDYEINYLKERLYQIKNNKNIIRKILPSPLLIILIYKITNREKNYEDIIRKRTQAAEQEVNKTRYKLDDYSKNKEKIILERCAPRHEKLAYTKKVVEGLYTLIAGAVGENQVVKELQKLSDKYVLFNDYSLDFDPPIYNKKEGDRIHSIQVDHLLVSNSGIFLIETKNWSKKSIESYNLRSPVEQIKRTSYALFVLLNSDSKYNELYLEQHHWGAKKVPIRNVIVMIHEKPSEEFKFTKVLTLKELNGYISYFDPIFSDAEVKSISARLSSI